MCNHRNVLTYQQQGDGMQLNRDKDVRFGNFFSSVHRNYNSKHEREVKTTSKIHQSQRTRVKVGESIHK